MRSALPAGAPQTAAGILLPAGPFHEALAAGVLPPLLGLARAGARGGDPGVGVCGGEAAIDDLERDRARHHRARGSVDGELIGRAQSVTGAGGRGRRRAAEGRAQEQQRGTGQRGRGAHSRARHGRLQTFLELPGDGFQTLAAGPAA